MTYSREELELALQLESLKEAKRESRRAEREAKEAEAEAKREARRAERERKRAQEEAERGPLPCDLADEFIEGYIEQGLKVVTVLSEHTPHNKPLYSYNPSTGDLVSIDEDLAKRAIEEWRYCKSANSVMSNTSLLRKAILHHDDTTTISELVDPDHCLLTSNGQVIIFREECPENEPHIMAIPLEEYSADNPSTIFKARANFFFDNETYTNLIQAVVSNEAEEELDRFLPSIYRDFWQAHLDAQNAKALLECLGNLIIPITSGRMRIFSVWQGARRTGKSATGDLVKQLLPGLVGTVNFCQSRYDSWDYSRSRRLIQQELPDVARIDSSKMKADSSGDSRELEFKYVKAGAYKTSGSLACVLAANSTPQIGDQLTNAISDRLQYINFRNSYQGDDGHNVLLDGTEEEKKRLVCVCLLALEFAYEKGKFTKPTYELAGISEDSSDVLKRWAGAMVTTDVEGSWVYYEDLAENFAAWCDYNLEDYGTLVTPAGKDFSGNPYPARWTRGTKGKGQASIRALMKQLGVRMKRTNKSWAFNLELGAVGD